MIMKKRVEKNEHLVISIRKLEIADQQISDHWNSILVNIAKPQKSQVQPRINKPTQK
jgi:hypothetical protein